MTNYFLSLKSLFKDFLVVYTIL